MLLIVFYSKLLLYNDLGGYNAESPTDKQEQPHQVSFDRKMRVSIFPAMCYDMPHAENSIEKPAGI